MKKKRKPAGIGYLTLQATREGQASYAHVHEIIGGLRSSGWTVTLFEPSYARRDRAPGSALRALEFLRVQARMALQLSRFEVLYVRHHFAAFMLSLAARIRGVPVVHEVNGPHEDVFIAWPFTRRIAWVVRWMTRKQLEWADEIVIVSEPYRRWVEDEVGPKRMRLITNGANTDMFHPRAEPHHDLPERYVLFFGALAPWQGIDVILEALEDPVWPDDVPLVVVGDGAAAARIKLLVAQGAPVCYLGKLRYAEMPGVITRSLACLSVQTNLENRASLGFYPLKVFESLACRVPVIVSRYPGQADLVERYQCGVVVPSDDPVAVAAAVRRLYSSPQEREEMAERGYSAVHREHSWRHRADATSVMLHDVLSRNGVDPSQSGKPHHERIVTVRADADAV